MQRDSQSNQGGNDRLVMYVDDEVISRHYFTRICEKHYAVITTENSQQALDYLESNHQQVAVLVSDQKMPGMQGTDLLQEVSHRYPDIIRLLTTAYMENDNSEELIHQGKIFSYIIKPWDIDELINSIHLAMKKYEINNTNSRNKS